jgi:DNA-binding transcriptional MerR regulator
VSFYNKEKDVKYMYTIGQFAKKTGMTIRALRFYDEKGILKPAALTDGGQRLYNDENIVEAQKIATYKYLDFSIEEMKALLKEEVPLLDSLKEQKSMLEEKKKHIESIINTLDTAISIYEKVQVSEPTLLLLVMHSLLTEDEQKSFLLKFVDEEIVEEMYSMMKMNFVEINRRYIEACYQLKIAYSENAPDEEVKELIWKLLNIMPQDLLIKIAEAFKDVENLEVDTWLFPSPFTQDEEQWLLEQMAKHQVLGDDFFEAENG